MRWRQTDERCCCRRVGDELLMRERGCLCRRCWGKKKLDGRQLDRRRLKERGATCGERRRPASVR
jgi:hypothetical protein